MARPYRVLGPIEVPRGNDDYIEPSDLRNFWAGPEKSLAGISTAHGVYMFAMRAGNGYTPWYVGKTVRRRGFSQEVFDSHKLVHYNKVLRAYKSGTPVIFLVYPVTPVNSVIRRPRHSEVDWVERHLISVAIEANPKLRNTRDTSHQREVQIPGILNAAATGEGISHFLRALNRGRRAPRRTTAEEPALELSSDMLSEIFDAEPAEIYVDPGLSEEIAQVSGRTPSKVTEFLFGRWLAERLAG